MKRTIPKEPLRARAEPAGKAYRRRPGAARGRILPAPRKGDEHAQTALAVLEQFRLIFRSAKKHFQWVQERTGVTGAQLWVLAELRRTPGMRVTELARAMAVHQTTASNLIERLVREKMIRRERSETDGRVVNLRLTPKGSGVIASAPLPLEGVLPDALRSLTLEDLDQLHGRLDKLARLMKVRDASGKRIPLADM
jgi:DNA-binding MarR family transcriptional regulator